MIPQDGPRTEIDAAVDAAQKPEIQHHGHERIILRPEGWQLDRTDLEKELDAPRRLRGTTTVDNSDSFLIAVNNQSPRGSFLPVVYANPRDLAITAVLNHQQVSGGPSADTSTETEPQVVSPGWGDHRVKLALTRSPEWLVWKNNDGKYLSQDEFAQFIQDRIDDIKVGDSKYPNAPDQATMLELARSFALTQEAHFDRRIILQSGQVRMHYTEEQNAQAGETGQIEIPEFFTLGIRPFYGASPVFVGARFRYRVVKEKLALGYQLVRPDLVEEAVYNDELEKVEAELNTAVVVGSPPSV